jgi:tetratricopeptide (TPR) repeat protein
VALKPANTHVIIWQVHFVITSARNFIRHQITIKRLLNRPRFKYRRYSKPKDMIKLSNISKILFYLMRSWRAINRTEKLWNDKKYHELILFCDVLLQKNPHDDLALYYKGLANESLGFLDEAISYFQQAEKIVVDAKWRRYFLGYYSRIFIQLSVVYNKKQNRHMAFYYADKAILANNKAVNGLKWRATLKEDIGDYIGASEDLNEALRCRPKDAVLKKLRDRLTYTIVEERKEASR